MTFNDRAGRARLLAERYPASREILIFYAALADWQGGVSAFNIEALRPSFPSLLELVSRIAPPPLADAARTLRSDDFDRVINDFLPLEFFGRALRQPYAAALPPGVDCQWCAKPPQAGCLLPQADGQSFEIVCGLCLRRRPFPRTRCPGCNESAESKISSFTSPGYAHMRLQVCDTCHGYLQVVDLSRDPSAIPEVDELAGLPLDLWIQERGYHKLQPNIAGV